MAAAEARALWQRTTNRCFIQEDAKRAPKLACCSSTSSSLSKSSNATKGASDLASDFDPFNHESSYSNLTSDSRWWLQIQPNYIYQMGLTKEQVNNLDTRNSLFVENESDSMKQDSIGEGSYEFVEMDSLFKKVDEFSLDSNFPHWMGNEKNHELPWWRVTDKEDLASFVAQRSLSFIENCDLPQPLNTSFKRDSCGHDGCPHEKDGIWKLLRSEFRNLTTVHARQNAISGVEISGSKIHKDSRETPIPEMDPSKAELLEALRHSQTRAREAEKAAKQANMEKEHVVKLIFKQASQIFAYKQWLYLRQLEHFYTQIKSQPMSSIFPVSMPRKTKKTHKNRPKKKPVRAKCGVVFAVGLGLVGAGLLLGWTVGWIFI